MKYFYVLLFFSSNFIFAITPKNKVSGHAKPTIHVISIGINEYSNTKSRYAVSDSKAIVEKIKKDTITVDDGRSDPFNILPSDFNYNIHILNDKEATLSGVKDALKDVISKANSQDYFIFYFGGTSFTIKNSAFLGLYGISTDIENIKKEGLSFRELSQFSEQIQCKNQLIIAEAGYGEEFAENLIIQLFESNSLISANSDRNRIIVTTKGLGYKSATLKSGGSTMGGPLVYYVLNSGVKLLEIFYDIDNFDFKICKAEIKLNLTNSERRYSAIYSENEYKRILLNKPNSRGSVGLNTKTEDKKPKENIPKTYALLIATNNYNDSNEWKTLNNPINDSESIAKILESKYNVIVNNLYNETQNNILEEIIKIKKLMNENDKFIFFIAGHGYFSTNLSDGFLVMKDSNALNQDIGLKSYLSMATLKMLLDNMPSKNVFVVFDVCFGASFDLLSKDLALSELKNIEKDISLDEFINRKNAEYSRIFLASGRYEVPDFWNNSLRHSPFADKLIKTLESQKDFVSPSILFSAMEGNATTPFLKQFGKHAERGDFLLKVVNQQK